MVRYLYVGSGAAVRSTWRGGHNTVDVEHMSFQYGGESDDEAFGWAMKTLHEHYPISQGYSHHHVRIDRQDPTQWQELLDALAAGRAGDR